MSSINRIQFLKSSSIGAIGALLTACSSGLPTGLGSTAKPLARNHLKVTTFTPIQQLAGQSKEISISDLAADISGYYDGIQNTKFFNLDAIDTAGNRYATASTTLDASDMWNLQLSAPDLGVNAHFSLSRPTIATPGTTFSVCAGTFLSFANDGSVSMNFPSKHTLKAWWTQSNDAILLLTDPNGNSASQLLPLSRMVEPQANSAMSSEITREYTCQAMKGGLLLGDMIAAAGGGIAVTGIGAPLGAALLVIGGLAIVGYGAAVIAKGCPL